MLLKREHIVRNILLSAEILLRIIFSDKSESKRLLEIQTQ